MGCSPMVRFCPRSPFPSNRCHTPEVACPRLHGPHASVFPCPCSGMAGPLPLWPLPHPPAHLPIPFRCLSVPPIPSPPLRPHPLHSLSLSPSRSPSLLTLTPSRAPTLPLSHAHPRSPLTSPPPLPTNSLLCFFFTINTSLYVFGEFATLVACPSCCPFDPADNIAGVPAAYLPNRCMAPIDIVYTWVNGSDPIWAERMRHFKRLHAEGKVQRRRLLGNQGNHQGSRRSRRSRGRRGGALRSPAPSKGPKGFDDDLAVDPAADPAVISPSPAEGMADVAPTANATLFHLLAAALLGDSLGGSAESDPRAADFFSGVNWNLTVNNSVGCGGNGSNGSNCTNGTNGSTAGGHVRILHHRCRRRRRRCRRPTLTGQSTNTYTSRAASIDTTHQRLAILAFTGKCYAPSHPHHVPITFRPLRPYSTASRFVHPLACFTHSTAHLAHPAPSGPLLRPFAPPLCSAPFTHPSHPSTASKISPFPLPRPPLPRPHPRTRTPRGTA